MKSVFSLQDEKLKRKSASRVQECCQQDFKEELSLCRIWIGIGYAGKEFMGFVQRVQENVVMYKFDGVAKPALFPVKHRWKRLPGTQTSLTATKENRLIIMDKNQKETNARRIETLYKHFGKRIIDLVLSGIGIVVFSIPMFIIALFIKLSDPGPAFFKQKRVGIHKKHFMLLKFRSMKMSTPHDIPTHQLENPEQYLLKFGAFLRKYSLDELPQLFNIFLGEMSIIGPRPALWNQYDLIAERDTYGANDVKPGLSGLAQISGRDELEIPVKAKLDGEYVKRMSFWMDCRCFFGTIGKVLRHDGVVEGGTGEMKRKEQKNTVRKNMGENKQERV